MLIANLFKYWTYQVFAPSKALKEKYTAFKSLLAHDKRAHELMAALEDLYYGQQKSDFNRVIALCSSLSEHVGQIVRELGRVCPGKYADLTLFYKKIDAYIRHMTVPDTTESAPPHVCWLEELDAADLQLAGGKALNLGIIRNELKLPVPNGYVITTRAYHYFIEHNKLDSRINTHLANIDIDDTQSLEAHSTRIQELIGSADLPADLAAAISEAHAVLMEEDRAATGAALRSSAVGEDSRASFAGQYLTFLSVQPQQVIDTYKKIIAGKFSAGAIAYRISYGLLNADTPMAVLVLPMVGAESSGVMYTDDPTDPGCDHLKIHSIWGLGELLVSGQTAADTFTLAKTPPFDIIERHAEAKSRQMLARNPGHIEALVSNDKSRTALSLADNHAKTLAHWGITLERHYREAQDVEWAVDDRGQCYILQSRPLYSRFQASQDLVCEFENVQNDILYKGGEKAATGIAAGTIYNLKRQPTLQSIHENAILVAANALPEYAKIIHRLGAIITDAGSPAGHLASVAREFGLPMLVNTRNASDQLDHGRQITINAEACTVYDGTVSEMLESACAKPDLSIDSPFMRKLEYIVKFVAPLDLVDPQADTFAPQYCRSLHDIIRFAHEKAVGEMFHVSDNRLRKLGLARKLTSDIPMYFYVLDVGGGLAENTSSTKDISIDQVENQAMRALWAGLTHPGIQWGDFSHFDWEAHDRTVMSGGIASPESTMYASHAVISNDYMNLNLRFGYHFVIVDAQCSPETSENIILFRFSGGGAEMEQRMLRTDFLTRVLRRLGFDVTVVSDLIDGHFSTRDNDDAHQVLDLLGRLLGATRLMDMYLKDPAQIEGFVDDFMQGRYHFASTEM